MYTNNNIIKGYNEVQKFIELLFSQQFVLINEATQITNSHKSHLDNIVLALPIFN